MFSGAGSGSGRLSSRHSHTPRDVASFSLEMEVQRMKEENQQLQEEVLSLRKVAATLRGGGRFATIHTVFSVHKVAGGWGVGWMCGG